MKKLLIFFKKNKVTQFVLTCTRVIYFFPYKWCVRKLHLTIASPEESVQMIVSRRLSVARFGDGEFNLAFQQRGIGFQRFDNELQRQLLDVMTATKAPTVSLALPHGYYDTSEDRFKTKTFWWSYVVRNRHNIANFRKNVGSQMILDASFTRVITELKNKNKINRIIEQIKLIWKKKTVLIVEGSGTQFGNGNDLLASAARVFRIIAPAENAYDKVSQIRHEINSFIDSQETLENVVVLIALGPTATVLAHEFGELVQTIDIGHFDLQYEYLVNGSYDKVKLSNRYDNEMINGNDFIPDKSEKYKSEIIALIN
ncbi:DUF1792 domain-containing protein [Lactiplantibacillus pentosus]|uniref:GT-D fold domain-containing glycosyltransferase n=1 Tax=Lactiplantibacillus pentosus TaxID=1589 RepID=UPI000D016C2F|nr:GT-D fold domain-containing glycosyltransferase [Lactiplantibacillus pentosus]PRO75985.1 DUF1792 domain-containing protein [Lactiplantibacillus pentosus]